jgi:PHD/YefM family antitoxin component YafN of YafNO toxin-antitoxin module
MATVSKKRNDSIIVSALNARSNFGKLLCRVDVERRSFVIERRGTPAAVLMNLQDYVKLAAPEPEALKIIGQEVKQSGASQLTSRQIDQSSRRPGRNEGRANALPSSRHRHERTDIGPSLSQTAFNVPFSC